METNIKDVKGLRQIQYLSEGFATLTAEKRRLWTFYIIKIKDTLGCKFLEWVSTLVIYLSICFVVGS